MPSKPLITELTQVLRPKGRNWEIITDDTILKDFLDKYSDYSFFVTARGRCHDIFECSGGNAFNWTLIDKDIVHIDFQFDDEDPCRIQLNIFWGIIERLAVSRGLREKLLVAEQEYEQHHTSWIQGNRKSCKRCGNNAHEIWEKDRLARNARRAQDIPFQFA